ncbi:MAG: hypothetical protein QOE70_5372 [Chthoniobacter sp.]|jgi:hypothetical protein|nr:hypothetical protein [Chthoniobacter sp.]
MKSSVLTFEPNGTVCGLYTEAIPLTEIGALQVNRLTTIEFTDSTQQWDLRDRAGTLLFSNPSRERCLQWEHRQFNQ